MFTAIENVTWYATRFKMVKACYRQNATDLNRNLCVMFYSQLLTTAFTVLFNERLAQKGKCI